MIDELIPKTPEPRRVVVETEQKRRREEIISTARSKKIVGGIVNRNNERAEASSPNLKVSWAWYNEERGIVAWTLQNISAQQTTGILFRNSYYFGNAYWPVYKNNPGFGVIFAANLEPLRDKSVQNNSAPLGVISWKQADGPYKSIVAFVFTLFPSQTWQMLEAGFSHLRPPQNIRIFEVSRISEADSFTLAYDQEQVDAWNEQTGNSDKGFAPNPNVINTVQVLAPPEAPFEQLFKGDSIHQGNVPAPAPKEQQPEKEEVVLREEEKDEEHRLPQYQEEEVAPVVLEAPATTGSGSKSLWSLLGKSTSSGKN